MTNELPIHQIEDEEPMRWCAANIVSQVVALLEANQSYPQLCRIPPATDQDACG